MFIEIRNVSKWFGDVIALNDVSLKLESGSIGLVGLNGAGKTTLIKILVGMLKPTEGEVFIQDEPIWENLDLYREIGYCPEIDNQMDFLTGKQFVKANLELQGYPREIAEKLALQAIKLVHMEETMDRKIKGYSRGMRQRIKIAQAIAHDPQILFLDEPLQGLDPIGRYELTLLFNNLASHGKNIIVSSHVLHELERISETVVFIDHGKILGQSRIEEIRSLLDEIPRKFYLRTNKNLDVAKALISIGLISEVQMASDHLVIGIENPKEFSEQLPDVLEETETELIELRPVDESLEAVFNYIYRGRRND